MQFSFRVKVAGSPDALIIPIAQQASSDAAFALIAKQTGIPEDIIRSDFKAEWKEIHTLYPGEGQGSRRIILLGLGEKARPIDLLNAFRSLVFKRKNSLPARMGISFSHQNAPENPADWAEAAVNGMLLGRYDLGLYKTERQNGATAVDPSTMKVEIFADGKYKKAVEAAIAKGIATGETQLEVFNLVNAPANKMTPQAMAEWAVNSGKKYGYKVQVFDKKGIEKLGLHALLAVSRGSELPPAFIVMEYLPKGKKPSKKIGFVGKGVTYDTGGLSIKTSAGMYYMKSDMGGAATVLGIIELAAKLELPFHLFGVIPATENSVDAKSVRPGDVIDSYHGKTIEVVDTDAEGRLVLADGLCYTIRKFKPDVLIDMATLTGSCVRTFGYVSGGLFSNNDELAAGILAAAEKTGERLWQLPLWDDYRKEMKSDIADVKNLSSSPAAGAITAAKFLEEFIEDHPSWAHLDIAGMVFADSEFSSQKAATAYGVRLLISYIESLKN